MNLDGALERLEESGDSFKDGFLYILGFVDPGLRLAGGEENRQDSIGEEISQIER